VETFPPALEGDQTQTVREDLILDHRRVVLDKDVLNGERRDLGEEDAAEGVGERGVDADEGEGGMQRVILVKGDVETVAEAVN
jgi:hypothetical protein